jgi:Cu/Ag efflux pump CusA
MGIAVIGGLLFGSVLTLYVIPAMYVLLHPRGVARLTTGEMAGVTEGVSP